ncbi:hypothetical protein [Kangiella marina]|uniref:Uncharacterized protein n=1 Tax=Kangiella marina TaxID=1079178 RepID=A0ABP8IHV1_9GAMM
MKYLLGLVLLAGMSAVDADEFNHGNHNDPYNQFFNGTESVNCGSMSLSQCSSGAVLEPILDARCTNKVVSTDNGGAVAYGDPYYHNVSEFNVVIQSASGPTPYVLTVSFKCGGYLHPGIRMAPSF